VCDLSVPSGDQFKCITALLPNYCYKIKSKLTSDILVSYFSTMKILTPFNLIDIKQNIGSQIP